MAIAFQVTEFQTVIKKEDGNILRSNGRPPMSFDYEVLTFTPEEKSRFWRGQKYTLSADEIIEVETYVNSVEADTTITEAMTQIHQSKSILAATDWYVTRKIETGKDIPDNILEMRATAREIINEQQNNL